MDNNKSNNSNNQSNTVNINNDNVVQQHFENAREKSKWQGKVIEMQSI